MKNGRRCAGIGNGDPSKCEHRRIAPSSILRGGTQKHTDVEEAPHGGDSEIGVCFWVVEMPGVEPGSKDEDGNVVHNHGRLQFPSARSDACKEPRRLTGLVSVGRPSRGGSDAWLAALRPFWSASIAGTDVAANWQPIGYALGVNGNKFRVLNSKASSQRFEGVIGTFIALG